MSTEVGNAISPKVLKELSDVISLKLAKEMRGMISPKMSEELSEEVIQTFRLRLRYGSDDLQGALKQLRNDVIAVNPSVSTSTYFRVIKSTFSELCVSNALNGFSKTVPEYKLDGISIGKLNQCIAHRMKSRRVQKRLRIVYDYENWEDIN